MTPNRGTDNCQTYLNLTSSTIIDVNPSIPDADWLRKWSLRQKSRDAINPAFPEGYFDLPAILHGRIRCLFTLAELDECARSACLDKFHGFLSLIVMEVKLVHCLRASMLLSGECCTQPLYANQQTVQCKKCHATVQLRLNPKIIGYVIDETGMVSSGRLVLSDQAWHDLLGRDVESLLQLNADDMGLLSDHIAFCRLTFVFGWGGGITEIGDRICVLAIRNC
jgi:hypothetical protein